MTSDLKLVFPRTFRHWCVAGILACATIWAISLVFVDDGRFYVWDDTLQMCVSAPGQVIHWRSEGWGTTHYGKHGVVAIPDVERTPGPKAIIWGDSYVEALQVSDEDKMSQQASTLWRRSHTEPLTFVGIGRAGASTVDYYFHMPKYEKIVGPIEAHFIVIDDIRDMLPSAEESSNRFLLASGNRFLSEPDYHLEEREVMPSGQRVKRWISVFHMNALISLARSIVPMIPGMDSKASWRFGLGPVDHPPSRETEPITGPCSAAFSYFLSAFKKIEKAPIIFVFLPCVPSIKEGAITFLDPGSQPVELFADECKKQGFAFINMQDAFIRLFKETGRFPRGFSNTEPGVGHMNKYGHKVVAEALCRYMGTQ